MMTRREALILLGGSVAGLAWGGGTASPLPSTALPRLAPDRRWLAKLGEGLGEELDYTAEVEGSLPPGLAGTLYRNGPGLFERDGFRKWTLLDGDGMIRATTFADGTVRFRNRFVRTAKYRREDAAGRFLYPTWTTPAPGFFDNIPEIPSRSQAGITPVFKGGQLYAFDEAGNPYVLDPKTLETAGEIDPYEGTDRDGPTSYKAHTKTDGETGNWVLVGGRGRRNPDLHVLVKDGKGRQIAHAVAPNPRHGYVYYHDFFWAGRYAVFHLHPAFLSPLPMLVGMRTFADSLAWTPQEGGVLLLVDSAGELPPMTVDVPATWMWHSLNAFASGDTIVADFVGYDAPDHFLGPEAALRAIMQGREGVAKSPGTLRRFTIDLTAKRARMETINDGHFEFPIVHPARMGHRHRYAYLAAGNIAQSWFHTGIARIDTDTGARSDFHFGSDHYVGEPVFAADPAAATGARDAETRGWLLCEVLDGARGKSSIAVFNAARIADGPVATVRLTHHLPMSFHGWWQAAYRG
jgi:all-trans-8'-apo-beta-carotenal 15,15'-oxygenase